MTAVARAYGTFISDGLSGSQPGAYARKRFPLPAGTIHRPRPDTVARTFPMLDIAYLVIGAVFLGVCVLYALACDRL